MNLEEFKKITGMTGKDFCRKNNVSYQKFYFSLRRGYSVLQPNGGEKHPLDWVYRAIKARCYNKNCEGYKYYGARGIKMSGEFFYDFKAFADYMGEKPGPEYSIDRIDNNKGYERGNLRWATNQEQSLNTRIYKNNKTGYKNISKRRGKYIVSLRRNKISYHFCQLFSLDNAICSKYIIEHRIESGHYS